MTGPLVLGVLGAVVVLAAALINSFVVRADSPRYKLHLLNTYNQGADVKKMVQDMSRINRFVVLGASLQLAAIIWQASSK
jgi:hypothetical protein